MLVCCPSKSCAQNIWRNGDTLFFFFLLSIIRQHNAIRSTVKDLEWGFLLTCSLNNIQTKIISWNSSSTTWVMFKASYSMSFRRDVLSGVSDGRYHNWNKVSQEATVPGGPLALRNICTIALKVVNKYKYNRKENNISICTISTWRIRLIQSTHRQFWPEKTKQKKKH